MTNTLTPLELDATQLKTWDEAVAALTYHCPAFTHVMYSLMDTTGQNDIALFTNHLSVAGTDGKTLLINPDNFLGKDLNLANRLFVLAHEISHVIFEHMVIGYACKTKGKVQYLNGTSLPYDHDLMNCAMDYIINAMLIASKIGEMPKGQFKGLFDPNISATGDDELFDVYRKIYQQQGGNSGGGGGKGNPSGKPGKSDGDGDDDMSDHGGGFCQHAKLGSPKGKTEHETAANHNSQAVQGALEAGLTSARLMGKLPAALERTLGKLLTPKVSWRDHIRALIMRKAGSGGYDFQRADDELILRDIYAPARSGHGANLIVCGVDTSGSVTDADFMAFYSEVAGIIDDIRPRQLRVIWCDAKVNKSEEVHDSMDLLLTPALGGGGTNFIPVFDEITRLGLKPDALIYLTDGQGLFPQKAPDYHVIWGSIYDKSEYPFGDVVDVPKQAA